MKDELRERVMRALSADYTSPLPGAIRTENYDRLIEVVLTALGLDDLDAAAHRLAVGWYVNAGLSGDERGAIALTAALTPPERRTSPTHDPEDRKVKDA